MKYIDAKKIANFLKKKLIGENININNISSIDKIKKNSLSFISNQSFSEDISKKALIIVKQNYKIDKKSRNSYIKVNTPRATFASIVEKYFYIKKQNIISNSSSIGADAKIGKNVFIGENVVIENGCSIGNNSCINHNAVVLKNCSIGNNCNIGASSVIGGDGFGTFRDDSKNLKMVPHLGKVIIQDYVEIGTKASIDRGVIENTLIKKYTKIGTDVHVGHNCVIGENCELASRVHTSGSVIIGKNCFIGANSSIKNGIKIGTNCKVGIGAVVKKNIKKNSIVASLEAISLRSIVKIKKKIDYK